VTGHYARAFAAREQFQDGVSVSALRRRISMGSGQWGAEVQSRWFIRIGSCVDVADRKLAEEALLEVWTACAIGDLVLTSKEQ